MDPAARLGPRSLALCDLAELMGENRARSTADAVLTRLDLDPPWHIRSVEEVEPVTSPPDGLSYPQVLLVRIGPDASDETVGVHFTLDVEEPQAIAAVAGQIQDHVIEAVQGQPLPRCPGHAHPLTPRVLDGVAMWVCPKDVGHHREPVLGRS